MPDPFAQTAPRFEPDIAEEPLAPMPPENFNSGQPIPLGAPAEAFGLSLSGPSVPIAEPGALSSQSQPQPLPPASAPSMAPESSLAEPSPLVPELGPGRAAAQEPQAEVSPDPDPEPKAPPEAKPLPEPEPKPIENCNQWIELAKRGDGRAQYEVGRCYEVGDEFQVDLERAERWYQRSAESGYDKAYFELGRLALDASQSGVESVRALGYFREGALWGDVRAQIALAEALARTGTGSAFDPVEARFWFNKGAEAGHAGSQFHLSRYLSQGIGGARDEGMAVLWLHRAAEQGHFDACYELGRRYVLGQGVLPSRLQALRWLRRAQAVDPQRAEAYWGMGRVLDVPGIGAERGRLVLGLYLEAARHGHAAARARVVQITGSAPEDLWLAWAARGRIRSFLDKPLDQALIAELSAGAEAELPTTRSIPLRPGGSRPRVDVILNFDFALECAIDPDSDTLELPAEAAGILRRRGTLDPQQRVTQVDLRMPDGTLVRGDVLRIWSLHLGAELVRDVDALIVPDGRPCVLGARVLEDLGGWRLQLDDHRLLVGEGAVAPFWGGLGRLFR